MGTGDERERRRQVGPPTVGVRLRERGALVLAQPAVADAFVTGEWVLVELAEGSEVGRVVLPRFEPVEDVGAGALPAVRRLTAGELAELRRLEEAGEAARQAAIRLAGELGLAVRVVAARYQSDGRRLRLVCAGGQPAERTRLVERLAARLGVAGEPLDGDAAREPVIGGLGRLALPAPAAGAGEPDVDRPAAERAAATFPALPRLNEPVMTAQGPGRVVRVQIARQTASVALAATGAVVEASLSELRPLVDEPGAGLMRDT